MLLGRVRPTLDKLQGQEQAGFRPGYSSNDVVHSLRMIAEKSEEWGEEVWAASLDLEKAFDKVFHDSVFLALAEGTIDGQTTNALWKIYSKQTAYVRLGGDKRSEVFEILRGVRQGDPLSPILFNNVTRRIFAELKDKWSKRGCGIAVGSDAHGKQRLTHMMFADDTTLFATSKRQLTRILAETMTAFAQHGPPAERRQGQSPD